MIGVVTTGVMIGVVTTGSTTADATRDVMTVDAKIVDATTGGRIVDAMTGLVMTDLATTGLATTDLVTTDLVTIDLVTTGLVMTGGMTAAVRIVLARRGLASRLVANFSLTPTSATMRPRRLHASLSSSYGCHRIRRPSHHRSLPPAVRGTRSGHVRAHRHTDTQALLYAMHTIMHHALLRIAARTEAAS